MKKNRMMRAASALLVAVLLTTCTISGTFAKYVTEATGSDSARVAKWGVTVVVAGSELFDDQYTDTTNGVTVKSLDAQKVVAPGTSSKESKPLTFKITGQPEVDVDLKFVMENVQEIVLKAGTYTDMTEVTGYDASNNPIYGKTFTLDKDYYPVLWTLKKNGTAVTACENVQLSVVADYLNGSSMSTKYDVEGGKFSSVTGEYTLEWAWAFEDGTNKDLYDAADTLLGNLMVDPSLVADTNNYKLSVGYKLTITATQVD